MADPRMYLVTVASYPDGNEILDVVLLSAWSARDAYDQVRIEHPDKAVRRVAPARRTDTVSAVLFQHG